MKQTSVSGTVSCVSAGSITHSVVRNTSTETWKRHISATGFCVSANVNPELRLRKHLFPSAETWRKHAQKVVRFRCKRSNGNASKRHETANGNTGYPSRFRNGFICFCDISVYGFLQFRPVKPRADPGTSGVRCSPFSAKLYPYRMYWYKNRKAARAKMENRSYVNFLNIS